MHICQMKIKVLYYWVLLHLQCNHHPSSISWKLLNKLNKLTQFQLRGWGEDAVNPSFVFFAITQTVFLIIHAPHFSVKSGLLYLLPEFSGILSECLILSLPD